MDVLVYSALLGGLGGLTRGVVGLLKALALKRKIIWTYYFITVAIAIIINIYRRFITINVEDVDEMKH